MRFDIIELKNPLKLTLTFNSLYEIPRISVYSNRSGEVDFQFSLWDSIENGRMVARLKDKSFNSLYEIRVRPSGGSSEGYPCFQFSLWDSYIFLHCLLRLRWRLSILFMRFATSTVPSLDPPSTTFNSLYEIHSPQHRRPHLRANIRLSILFMRFDGVGVTVTGGV